MYLCIVKSLVRQVNVAVIGGILFCQQIEILVRNRVE